LIGNTSFASGPAISCSTAVPGLRSRSYDAVRECAGQTPAGIGQQRMFHALFANRTPINPFPGSRRRLASLLIISLCEN